MNELKFVECSEDYCRKNYLERRLLCKVNNKVEAFITYDSKNGFSYAFGKPSQGSYLSFSGKNGERLTLEECKDRVTEVLQSRMKAFSQIGLTLT